MSMDPPRTTTQRPGRTAGDHEGLTTLLVVRHGHVAECDPPEPRLCGWYDASLSRRGRLQAEWLAVALRSRPGPAALYTSPLRRASETADILGAVFDLRAVASPDLREISCGRLDGLPLREVQRRHPDLWRRNVQQDDDQFRWPGGESRLEFRARVLRAAARIAASHRGERVLVVTHTGVVTQLVGAIEGMSAATWEAFRPAHAALTELLWSDGAPRVVRFNKHTHE